MIAVTFVTRSLEAGGAERQLVVLARQLASLGHRVTIILLYERGPLIEELENTSITLLGVGKRGRWDVLSLVRLARLVRASRPDFVHSYLEPANVLTAILKPFFGKATLVWGVRSSNMDLAYYDRSRRIVFQIQLWLSGVPDLIISNSDAGLRYLREAGVKNLRAVSIPNGVDTLAYKPSLDYQRRNERQALGVATDALVVGQVARIDPMKSYETFLEAARLFAMENSKAVFVCVGGGDSDYLRQLKNQTREFGLEQRVVWLGHHADVCKILGAFDVVTLASAFGEGFSNLLGEAASCGCIVVATDVGDARRILNGSGFVVPPRDSTAIAAAWSQIAAMGSEERNSRSAAARQRMKDNFSVDAMVERTLGAYRRTRRD